MNHDLNAFSNTKTDIDIYNSLSDENLMFLFKESESFKRTRNSIQQIIETTPRELLVDTLSFRFVSPGLKGVIRGNRFNQIVKEILESLNLPKYLDLYIETNTKKTAERPDWIIIDSISKKQLSGFNQIDFWTGGHQSNRGDKYINCMLNTLDHKILSVIGKPIQFKKDCKSKVFDLFQIGYANNTLCYCSQLPKIIYNFFEIKNE